MAVPRNKVNKVLEFRMDQARMNELTVDEMTAIGDIMSEQDNPQVVIMNTRHLRTFLARFAWDGDRYMTAKDAWAAMGPMRYDQMLESVQQIFTTVEDNAVPPTNEPESGSE